MAENVMFQMNDDYCEQDTIHYITMDSIAKAESPILPTR